MRPALLVCIALCASGCGGCVDEGSSGGSSSSAPAALGPSRPGLMRPRVMHFNPSLLRGIERVDEGGAQPAAADR